MQTHSCRPQVEEEVAHHICRQYHFINEPDDDLKCVICLDVARDPLQHVECGKLFCKQCLDRHGKDRPCANCRTEGSMYYPDKKSEQMLDPQLNNYQRKVLYNYATVYVNPSLSTFTIANE